MRTDSIGFAVGGLMLGGLLVWIAGTFSPKGGGVGNQDSPIVVSDDLHIRHGHHKNGAAPDFKFQTNGPVIAFSDSGSPIKSIKCKNLTPPGSPQIDCLSAPFPVNNPQWSLQFFASSDGSGPSLLTLTPNAANPPCQTANTYCIVNVDSKGNWMNGTQDTGSDPDTTGGTDMQFVDAQSNALKFGSVTLLDTSTNKSETLSCSSGCQVKINYK